MRVLAHFETLVYYDGPQLFIAHDQFGVRYVCLLVEQTEVYDKYLCVPVTSRNLQSLRSNERDLRDILQNPETGETFQAEVSGGHLESIEIQPIEIQRIPLSWFPEPGFVIHETPASVNPVVQEAQKRQRAIVEYTLNPPESEIESKITVAHLSQAIRLVQRLVKHAYRQAIREADHKLREVLIDPHNHELEVYAFSPGSFTVHMQSASPVDMFGYSQMAKALEILDLVTRDLEHPQEVLERIVPYRGHFATAYKDFLEFITANETSIAYEWSMPGLETSTRRHITTKQAEPLYHILAKHDDVGIEEVRFVGTLTKVDTKYGRWRLKSEVDQQEHQGVSDPSAGVNLDGLIVETQRYEFICEEQIKEQRGTGRETTELHLISYRTL